MLLSTQSHSESPVGAEKTNAMEEYLRILSGQEKEQDAISIDHSYCRVWHSHSDSHHVKPARLLFMKGLLTRNESSSHYGANIDVDTVSPTATPPYDDDKTRLLSNECDQFLTTSLPSDGDEEKEPLNKTGWSTTQKNLYKHVIKILNGNRLSRLSYSDTPCELVKRRIMIDKGAGKMRQVFASNSWDMKLLSWLHCTLIDTISTSLLSEYFEIMRTLKVKMSNLVDKLLAQFGTYHAGVFGACSTEAFNQLIQKPWDPVANALGQCKQRKLPGNALIIVVPSSPNQPSAHLSNRVRFWNGQLASLGKVIQMPLHISHNISVEECLHQLFTTTCNKVVEMRSQSPTRPIILLGWTIGALIACHVALEEPVSAVVCMGFPLKGVSGSRGDLDDPLLDSKIPTLFVVGQNSSMCSMDDIEDFRERMRSETGLVVVGGADDLLRVSVTKKKADGITQAMVDKCIANEIEEFLVPMLGHQNAAPVTAAVTAVPTSEGTQEMPIDDAKRQRRRPREYSPEISPAKKKPRPVGRPSTQKAAPSSSSSDTSSAGSCANESALQKDVRGLRRRSLSKSRLMRKKHIKPIVHTPPTAASATSATASQKSKEVKIDTNDSNNLNSKDTNEKAVTSTPTTMPSAKLNPAKILAEQLRNGPVDVEKAFGKDCSFLPRPLTPTEFDGNESPAKTSKPDGTALPENIMVDNKTSHTQITLLTQTNPSVVGVPLSSILGSPEKQKISFLQTSDTHALTAFSNPTLTIEKSHIVPKISDSLLDTNKTHLATFQKVQSCDLVSSLGKTLITSPQTKILSGNSTLNAKQVQSIVSSLTSKGFLSSSAISSPSTQTVLVSSPTSSNKSTFIVSNSESPISSPGKIQFRRMLVQTGANPLLSKLTSTVSIVEEGKAGTTNEQRVCNLSLLSDVAGMKEPIRQGAGEPSATLVKLSSSDSCTVKQYKLVESLPSSSPLPQRLETPEEQAEKQMAIRALNSSLREENNSSGSYSKFDNPHPMLGYSIIMPRPMRGIAMRQTRRPRGSRGIPGMRKPRVRHFYPFDQ